MQVQRQIDELLAQRAAEWLDALKSGERRDHAAFVDWLQQSKLHVEHYLDMECLDRQIQTLDPAQGPDVEALLASAAANVLPFGRGAVAKETSPKVWRRLGLVAAAVMGLSILGLLGFRLFAPGGQVSTTVGEQRILTLPDGSLIRMNVDTRLRIDYDAQHRDVDLLSGEAVFKVARDAVRPFAVHTSTATVRALGTEFNVYQRSSTTVSVLEGSVQLSVRNAQSAAHPAIVSQHLGVGEEAQVMHGHIEKRAHPDVVKTAAWRERRLYFDAMPLEEIVNEFNRYGGPVRLKMEGIAPGSHRFGGTFNADDPAALADILDQQEDLVVERRAGEIFIRPRR